jgi:hypothetical protein
MGATLAGFVSNAGWLVALSEHKPLVFGIAGSVLLATGIWRYFQRNAPCPIDPLAAKACMRLRRISAVSYWISVAIYLVGIFFAFIAVRLFY